MSKEELMAVYEKKANEYKRQAINASKKYKKNLIVFWHIKGTPKWWLIKQMARLILGDIQLWWTMERMRQLKNREYYNREE